LGRCVPLNRVRSLKFLAVFFNFPDFHFLKWNTPMERGVCSLSTLLTLF
jgi:hypothetical protein